MPRVAAFVALLAFALAVGVVAYPPRAPPHPGVDGRADRSEARGADLVPGVGVPVVVTGEHALESVWWRPDGHLLVLTPAELVDLDPDAPLPARRVALEHGRRIRGGAGGTFVVERTDGWESRDAVTLERLAAEAGGPELALAEDGRFVAAPRCEVDAGHAGHAGRAGQPTCRFVLLDARTGEVQARMPPGRDARSAGSFAFLPGGAPGSAWATLLSGGELTIVDFRDGTVHLRRRLRRLGDDGRSRELLELRGRRAYLTSAYGFEVVDLLRGLTLVRERDPQEGTDVTFAISDDGATVTEASTFAETLVTSWEVPVGASAAKVAAAAPAAREGQSEDERYLAALHAGSLSLTSLRSGAEVLHLGPPGNAPVDMFRKLTLAGGVPVLRDGRGRELVLSRERPAGGEVHDEADAGSLPPPLSLPPPPPPGMLLATEDARFVYFIGTERDDPSPALLPVLRLDRHTGESVALFAAARSAIAQFPDHAIDLLGDEDEARASIVCATETAWLPAATCLNAFVEEGRFDTADRRRSGSVSAERVR